MAIINKTGITNGGTIQSEHVTRAIDALSGVGTSTIVATGSFSGSLRGTIVATGSFSGSLRGSIAITGNSTFSGINVASNGAEFTYDINSKLNLNAIGKGIGVALPLQAPNGATTGSIYFDAVTPALWIYDGTQWLGYTNTLP